jgi:2-polyprenyl-3-methyl-5-hydroxy-6-metoxy-1,4-benzoquinol methylase
MHDYQTTWNNRYGGGKYLFGKEPNEYFKSKLDTLFPPASLLLPGEGEGRNAVYAAKCGWNVTALDFSNLALERAKIFAKKENVNINFVYNHLLNDKLPKNKFDVLGITFLHFNGENKRLVHTKLANALKTKGYVILECFSNEQLKLITGGPRNKDSLYTIEELQDYYSNFNFLELEYKKVLLSEGEAHQGEGYVIRMFAQKLKD